MNSIKGFIGLASFFSLYHDVLSLIYLPGKEVSRDVLHHIVMRMKMYILKIMWFECSELNYSIYKLLVTYFILVAFFPDHISLNKTMKSTVISV